MSTLVASLAPPVSGVPVSGMTWAGIAHRTPITSPTRAIHNPWRESLATSFHNGCHAGQDQAHDHDDEAREPPNDETGIGQKVGGHPKSQGEDQANKGNIKSLT